MDLVEKNKEYIVNITDINHDGQGVGRIGEFAVFVDGALSGETVKVKIIKVLKNYAIGKLLEISKLSPSRIEPFCQIYKRCGGCSLQHMDYKTQLDFKTKMVRESLQRIGKIDIAKMVVHETIGMGYPFEYRNKSQYPVGMADGKPVIGFYAKRSHDIVEVENCGIHRHSDNIIRKVFKEYIEKNKISVYDEKKHCGLVRHLVIRTGFKTGEIMVIVVINGAVLPDKELLNNDLSTQIPEIRSIVLNINTNQTNIIMGEENKVIYGPGTIKDYIGNLKFQISPLSFFQVNPIQAEVLYNKAVEFAMLSGEETVFDLYSGTGTIALFMAGGAKRVYGIEAVKEAVADADINKNINGISNAEFIAGEVEKTIGNLSCRGVKADVVVVDPPRKGCEATALDSIASMKPTRIVYVSCNPATLARDLAHLSEHGYEPCEVQPVDMFPWTTHVECVVLITRNM